MTSHFKNMLYLFGANANGAAAKIDEQINMEEIRTLSLQQGVWTMVYPELSKLCDTSKYQQEFLTMVSRGMMRTEFTLDILKKLEENGIKSCLLKGATISPLYNNPDCRISGDTDILINPKDEERVSELLLEYGYTVEKRHPNHHHMTTSHPIGGILEVHVSLYSKASEKFLFNSISMVNQPWDTMEIAGKSYYVLSIRDSLMYLTAHYIKHFVNRGGGVRQIMDLLLFIEKNKEKIDFAEYDKIMKDLKYDTLLDTVKTIGAIYFGFDYEIKSELLAENVLSDTEEGGIFGFSADNRESFLDEYCQKRSTKSKVKSKMFLSVNQEYGYKWFPKQEDLINKYKYKYAKFKILIPIAWIHRYVDVILGTRKPEVLPKDTKEFKERMKMMQDLGMIE
ncbi:MAG: hypothetical protein E7417_05275 [Ruminococcaceae bacterium]|nr:hypothetical protein [Oscillospiraceae bacterium]